MRAILLGLSGCHDLGQSMRKNEASTTSEVVPVLQTAVPGPSRVNERRLQRRRADSRLRLTFLGAEHAPINWSLGGFLVDDSHPHTEIGTITAGFLDIPGQPGRFAIRIELVRRDKRTKEIAFRLIEPSQALLNALSRVAE